MKIKGPAIFRFLIFFAAVLYCTDAWGQIPTGDPHRRFRITGGVLEEEKSGADSLFSGPSQQERDSLRLVAVGLRVESDSLLVSAEEMVLEDPDLGPASDSLRNLAALMLIRADSLVSLADAPPIPLTTEELLLAGESPIPADSVLEEALSRRERKRLERELREADTTWTRHNWLFRDSMPVSRLAWLSIPVPGLSQIHNNQPWKLPILYGVVGTTTYFGIKEHQKYRDYKQQYDYYYSLARYKDNRTLLDPIQKRMIRHNTNKQLLLGSALFTYLYFIADGTLNYAGTTTNVKVATTLSTLIPGAGQIYNRSYWRVPFVMGAFATFAYMVDWNNRGYQRFKTAYDIETDGNPDTVSDVYYLDVNSIKNYKDNYRRNRDLCIILLSLSYLLNIVDAHVDAHMKDYDVSDDLSISLEPSLIQFSSRTSGNRNIMGMSLKVTF